jgi:histidinol-phosphate aminotransferase
MFVNSYVKNLIPYKVVTHKAWEGKNDILKLDWNEATIPPSPKVFEAINRFLNEGSLNWYPDLDNSELLNKLATYVGLGVKNIQHFASSDSIQEYIVRTFVTCGDEVTIIMPTYDNFRVIVEGSGAVINSYYLEKDFSFNKEHFTEHLNLYKPKVVYICNPNNPTGTSYDSDVIEFFVKKFPNILFLVDEAYYEFSGRTSKDLVVNNDNIIITRTFSKAFALAGLRIGYVITSEKNIKIFSKLRNPKSVSSLAQVAVIGALDDVAYTIDYVNTVELAKKQFISDIKSLNSNKIKILFGDGNFVLCELCESVKYRLIKYLEENNVYIRDYSHLRGMEKHIRITIGTQIQMKKVFSVISLFISEIKNEKQDAHGFNLI